MSDYKKIPPEDIPNSIESHVDPNSPPAPRFIAAQGIAPLRPMERVFSLYILLSDPDQKIQQAAAKTFASLPENIFNTAIADDGLHPSVLEFIFRRLPRADVRRLTIIQNPSVSNETLELAAKSGTPEQLEIIADNQRRTLQFLPILIALYNNPETPKASLMRLIEYAQRDGIIVEEIPELTAASVAGISEPEIQEPVMPDWSYDEALGHAQEALPDLPEDILSQLPQDELMEIALGEMPDDLDDAFFAGSDDESEHLTLFQKLNKMTVAQKISLGQKGNKEARTLLLRETNKLILLSVINSPQITDGEALSAAQNKSMSEDVIRVVAKNKEWIKDYNMRLALVYNPKTPIGDASRMINTLNKRDLKDLAKTKNVPSAIATFAKKLFALRYKKG